MSRVCYFTGKSTRAGRSIARRGKAKYLGGVGRKTTGISKRKFKPNIQKVRALVDGSVVRLKVSAKALRSGLVVKPPKRNWQPEAQADAAKAHA
jgi:large subunit ribosomal protein L28